MRISDWSSDVCSSDLKGQQDRSDRHMVFPPADDFLFCLIACCGHGGAPCIGGHALPGFLSRQFLRRAACFLLLCLFGRFALYVRAGEVRSEEHTSELQSLMRISYAVFCLKTKKTKTNNT